MKKLILISELEIYETLSELPQITQTLFEKAKEAKNNAYAPYSNFKVGAAVLLENNEIVIGSNQENAAYPSGLCAERVAIYQAGALYPNHEIKQIVITAGSTLQETKEPVPPCGSCRQSMIEFEVKQKNPIAIYFMGETGEIYKSNTIKDLLPVQFNKKLL